MIRHIRRMKTTISRSCNYANVVVPWHLFMQFAIPLKIVIRRRLRISGVYRIVLIYSRYEFKFHEFVYILIIEENAVSIRSHELLLKRYK